MIYRDCKWCYGRGCTFCPGEYEKAEKRAMEPILTARFDSPEEMEELKSVMGREAIEKAFGPDGGGIQEIEYNAAVVNLMRVLRKSHSEPEGEA